MGLPARFWTKVDFAGTCWLWTGSLDAKGYGRFLLNGRRCRAHRVAYELTIGPIPAGLVIDHLCRVRHCVNPAHMEPVTVRENNMRGFGVGALASRRTHCPYGHPLDGVTGKRPQRICTTCLRARNARLTELRRLGLAKRYDRPQKETA